MTGGQSVFVYRCKNGVYLSFFFFNSYRFKTINSIKCEDFNNFRKIVFNSLSIFIVFLLTKPFRPKNAI